MHHSDQLRSKFGVKIYKALMLAKKINLVNKIGVSIYSFNELKFILNKFKFDIVSAPFNIVDQRLKKNNWLKRLKLMNIDIHIRSIFLQGLLLLNKRPRIFVKWNKLFDKWDRFISRSKKTRLEVCLAFILKNPEVDKIIIGFDNYNQFIQLIKKIKPINIDHFDKLSSNDEMLINPSNWKYL